VKRRVRGLLPVVIIALIVSGTAWLLYATWNSSRRDDLAVFGAFAVPVAVAAWGLITGVWRAQPEQLSCAITAEELDKLGDLLATAVKDQWMRAAGDRRLLEPEPIPVPWVRPSVALVGPVSAAVASRRFTPLPLLHAVHEQQLRSGYVQDLLAVYGGLGSGRLLIAGAPGSGKSGSAVLLVLAALQHREVVDAADRPKVPVPVMFTLHGWAPEEQRLKDWLTSRLRQTYPLLAGKDGLSRARALLTEGKLAVILDGLDEIPPALRPVALEALSRQATFRIVVLTRSAEMAAAVARGSLDGAACIELVDIDPASAASYLARVQLDPPPRGWGELINRLRNAPESPIAQALRSPLALTLVRDTYRSEDDIDELLDLCDSTDQVASPDEIVDHLLDRVIPAAYTRQPGQRSPEYDLPTAKATLRLLAQRMNQDMTRDLQWWRIPAWTSAAVRMICTGIGAGLLVGIALYVVTIRVVGSTTAFATALVGAVGIGVTFGTRGRKAKPATWAGPLPRRRMASALPLPASITLGLTAGSWSGIVAGVALGLRIGLITGAVAGVGAGFVAWLAARPSRATSQGEENGVPLTPVGSWRKEQTFGTIAGSAAAFVAGIAFGTAGGLKAGPALGAAAGVAAGVVAGTIVGVTFPATWTVCLAFLQLAKISRTPIRLMHFLEDARRRDVLRTVGPVYQFRHARLQDRLADQVAEGTYFGEPRQLT
jgi:hypothetical protein